MAPPPCRDARGCRRVAGAHPDAAPTARGTVMRTAGPGGRYRPGWFGLVTLLLVPLLGVTAASGLDDASSTPRVAAAAETRDAAVTRITYAGTRHRSLGGVDTTTSSTALFGTGPAHFDAQPSALGDRLVFVSRRDEKNPQVYLRSADGSVLRLTKGMNAAHPRLTRDGSVVFDSAGPGGADGGSQRDLWQVSTDGTGRLTQLTDTPADEQWPTVSPDGKRLAYSSDADPAAGQQIYVRDLAGGDAVRVTDPVNGTATEPVWNPATDDERRNRIAYTATPAGYGQTGTRLRVTDGTDGSTDRPLLGGEQTDWRAHGATWLPGGDEVMFLSPEITCECEGDWDHVFRTPAYSAATPGLVLNENREVLSPTWLGPLDGGRAVVERTTASGPHVATLQDVRLDGSDPRDLGQTVLTEDPEADTNTDPAKDPLFRPRAGYDPWTERQNYTPDGRRIVFTQFEGAQDRRIERIRIVDADGSKPEYLTLDERGPDDWDTDPAFSPDGKRLAFTRVSPGGVGEAAGTSRILIADVASGKITGRIVPPSDAPQDQDAQPSWSPDGTTLAFTRNHEIDGRGGSKHIWTATVATPVEQHDLSEENCPGACEVIDDSPAFSPDGRSIAFNRKSGGGRIDERNGMLVTSVSGDACRVLLPAAARDQAGACGRDLPDTTDTGPHQPRDAAWTADGAGLVFSARARVAANSPESIKFLDIASGNLVSLTGALPGRQKEPGVQQSVNLTVRAPGTADEVT
ncbi:PD40 domain-containing protein, partial [Streptomyces sp. UH6]|nr:PD40 domain-containing protein [Streptomyces sp. UH6]